MRIPELVSVHLGSVEGLLKFHYYEYRLTFKDTQTGNFVCALGNHGLCDPVDACQHAEVAMRQYAKFRGDTATEGFFKIDIIAWGNLWNSAV